MKTTLAEICILYIEAKTSEILSMHYNHPDFAMEFKKLAKGFSLRIKQRIVFDSLKQKFNKQNNAK